MSWSRSEPERWIVVANWTSWSLRWPSGLSESSRARMSRELSGVRSSCDMFARNSDLYCEEVANRAAFSSSWAFERCNSACCRCISFDRSWSWMASRWDSPSSDSVRELAMMVLMATPMVFTNWSKNARWTSEKREKEASSITPRSVSSKRIGMITTDAGAASPSPLLMLM